MAQTTKKYYWLKLNEGFFRDKKIKKLRKIAGGDTYTVIYLKMQLLSLKTNGKLFFEGVEDNFVEEVALEIDEDVDNVKVTVAFLMNNGLLEEVEEDAYILPQTIESIGSESSSAERVRRHRAKKKQIGSESKSQALPPPEDKALQCNTDETNGNTEIEIEKEIDKEKREELTDRQRERVDLLRDMFASWPVSDFQIFYLSTLVNDKIPYGSCGLDQRDLKIYDYLQSLINRAKADGVTYIYRWLIKMIPEIDMD